MEQYYYIDKNGQQQGPVEANELSKCGVTLDTLVWKQGMADWQAARTLLDLHFVVSFPKLQYKGTGLDALKVIGLLILALIAIVAIIFGVLNIFDVFSLNFRILNRLGLCGILSIIGGLILGMVKDKLFG